MGLLAHAGSRRGVRWTNNLSQGRAKATGSSTLGTWPDAGGWPVEYSNWTNASQNTFLGPGDLNATSGTYIQNGSSSGNGFGANLVRITSVQGTTNDRNRGNFSYSTSTINHNVQVGDELTVIYTSGNGVDALATVQSIVSSTQFIVNIPNPQNTSTSGNCTFYPTHKTGCGFFYSGACMFTGDTWHLNPETFDLFYKLKVAGPPSYYRNAMRFDHRMSIEYDQVSGGELANNDIHYGTASNPEANKSAMMSNNGSSGHRAMIFESDAFFKSIDNSTDSDFTPGSHGRSDTPLKNIARHDSGSETMGLVKDGVLILNTDGTLKIKMGREGTSNARLLLFKDGAGSATIFHNNTANSETTISANLTAGTYTLNWQLKVLSSWGFPGVTDATAPKVKITSEPT
tara:strand:- start:88 stop:1290 length:1203 start_codon:yes stop_codon:yes gene_type:complete